MERKPLQYQTLLGVLAPLPEEDRHYALAFLLAAERRAERRIEQLEQEEDEVRAYRKELGEKFQKLTREHKEKDYQDLARRHRNLSAMVNDGLLATMKAYRSRTPSETLEQNLVTALEQLNRSLSPEFQQESTT